MTMSLNDLSFIGTLNDKLEACMPKLSESAFRQVVLPVLLSEEPDYTQVFTILNKMNTGIQIHKDGDVNDIVIVTPSILPGVRMRNGITRENINIRTLDIVRRTKSWPQHSAQLTTDLITNSFESDFNYRWLSGWKAVFEHFGINVDGDDDKKLSNPASAEVEDDVDDYFS